MFNSLKNAFLYRLIRVLDHHFQRQAGTPWWVPNFCEPTVQLALRDFCRPGDTVFDVGANDGHLSVLISRLVGPRGIVCSFEASPRNLETLQTNLIRNGCGNVRVVHAAISAQSGSRVGFVYGSHPPADRLVTKDDTKRPDAMVVEMALDDFVEHFDLRPRVVKMDIEGAEFLAVQGFRRSIDRLRPILVLETSTENRDAVRLLRSLNYRIIDVSNYHELESELDFPPGVSVSNVLCLPVEINAAGYQAPLTRTTIRRLDASEFRQESVRSFVTAAPVELPVGRYVFEVEFEAIGQNNRLACGVSEFGKPIIRYEASTSWIRDSYRRWTWHCHHPSQLDFFFEFLNQTDDPTFKLHGVKILRVANLEQSWMATV